MERFVEINIKRLSHNYLFYFNHILIAFILTIIVGGGLSLYAQSVYVAIGHESYDFLKRMEARQLLIDYKDAALPLSRMQVATYLAALENKTDEMSRVERETFEFLKTEFNYELLKIAGDPQPSETRWHVLSRELTDGIFNLDADVNYWRTYTDGKLTSNTTVGLKTYGYAYDNVGFYFNLDDNHEKGLNISYSRFTDDQLDHSGLSNTDKAYYKRVKTPSRGVIVSAASARDDFQYDETNAQFSWQIGAFTLSLEKMNNVWGYGRNGTVIFSDHAPSYPQLKLRVPLSKDIEFVYFHGELNSDVIDSSSSYYVTYPNQDYSKFREVDHSKYIAAHQLEISLWKGVDFSIGESVVYSDRGPLFIYLIPVMFFKSGEHYNSDKDNCEIFGSIDLNLVKNVNAYLSLFIDEINTDKIFDPNLSRRQIAFTSGLRFFDIPATNCDLTIEYSRVNPATYNHSYPATTFTNNGFILGSWMGQNADDLFLELGFIPMHAVRFTTFGEIFRKGDILPLVDQYAADGGNKPFLFGPVHVERSFGMTAKYQPLRDLFINLRARIHKIEDEADPAQNRLHQFEFTLGASLGIW